MSADPMTPTEQPPSPEDVAGIVERLKAPLSVWLPSDAIMVVRPLLDQAAAALTALSAENKALREGAWELPEVEQDENGEITFRSFSLDRRRAVSWVLCPENLLRVESTVGETVKSERHEYLYPTLERQRLLEAEARVKALREERDEATAEWTWSLSPLEMIDTQLSILDAELADENVTASRDWIETIRENLRAAEARVKALEAERDEWKAEYFRRHKEAADNAERALIAESSAAKWKAEAERMVKALEAFAKVIVPDSLDDAAVIACEHITRGPGSFTAGDQRRARLALRPQEGK